MKLLVQFLLFTTSAVVAEQIASTETSTRPPQTLQALPSTVTNVPAGFFTTTQHIIIDGVTDSHVTIPAKTIDITIPTCIQTEIPDENGHVPPGTCGALWEYYPSFAAAVVFAVLFLALLVVHIWQAAKYQKAWCWVIIMASLWETLAFAFRAISSKNQQNTTIVLCFQIFILLAPLWVNAFAYMTLGRMIYFFHPSRRLLRIPATTIAAAFVVLDVVSFIIQLIGGGMAGPNAPPAAQRKGLNIYMAGIGLQEFFVVMFICLCIVFQRDMIQQTHDIGKFGGLSNTKWGGLLAAIYLSLSLITVRILYRLVEFSGGLNEESPLRTEEIYFFVFEAGPMFTAIAAFNLVHPGRIISGPGSEMPGMISLIRALVHRRKGREQLPDANLEEDIALQARAFHGRKGSESFVSS